MSHEPDRSPAASIPPGLPMCPNCRKQMQAVRAQRSPHFVNLDQWSYRCDCGETWDAMIAKKDCGLAVVLEFVQRYADQGVFRPEEITLLVRVFDNCWERLVKSGVRYGSDRAMQVAREQLGKSII